MKNYFCSILFIIFFSLATVSHADNYWKTTNIISPLDTEIKYLFYYPDDIQLVDIWYLNEMSLPVLTFNITKTTYTQMEFKTPKNLPAPHNWFILIDDIEYDYDYIENECLYSTIINATDSKILIFSYSMLPKIKLSDFEIHTIPHYCLPHTIADYPDTLETYENVRGEQVRVYLSSVLELLKRNYLAPIQNDID